MQAGKTQQREKVMMKPSRHGRFHFYADEYLADHAGCQGRANR